MFLTVFLVFLFFVSNVHLFFVFFKVLLVIASLDEARNSRQTSCNPTSLQFQFKKMETKNA